MKDCSFRLLWREELVRLKMAFSESTLKHVKSVAAKHRPEANESGGYLVIYAPRDLLKSLLTSPNRKKAIFPRILWFSREKTNIDSESEYRNKRGKTVAASTK